MYHSLKSQIKSAHMQRYRVLYLQVPIQLTCYKSLGFALSVDFAVLIYLIFIYRSLYQLPAFAIIKNHANNSGQCLLFFAMHVLSCFYGARAGRAKKSQPGRWQAKKKPLYIRNHYLCHRIFRRSVGCQSTKNAINYSLIFVLCLPDFRNGFFCICKHMVFEKLAPNWTIFYTSYSVILENLNLSTSTAFYLSLRQNIWSHFYTALLLYAVIVLFALLSSGIGLWRLCRYL